MRDAICLPIFVSTTTKMSLPKSINPNPVFNAIIELRITSNIERKDLLSLIYPKVCNELPKIQEGKYPHEIRVKNEELRYAPDHILSNDNFSLAFSNQVISFNIVGEYPLWDNYISFVSNKLDTLFSLEYISDISRIAVRFGSVFKEADGLKEVIKQVPTLNFIDETQHVNTIKTDIKRGDNFLHLQLYNSAMIKKDDKSLKGVCIDIDASTKRNGIDVKMPPIDIIEELHSQAKELFFGLLKEDYLKTLNPLF